MDADDSLYFLPDGIVDDDDDDDDVVDFGSSYAFESFQDQPPPSPPSQAYYDVPLYRNSDSALVSSRERPYSSPTMSRRDRPLRSPEREYILQPRHSPIKIVTLSPSTPPSISSSPPHYYHFHPSSSSSSSASYLPHVLLPQSHSSSPSFRPPGSQPFHPSISASVFTPATAAATTTTTTTTLTPTLPPPPSRSSFSAFSPPSSPFKKPPRSGGKPSPLKNKMSPQKRTGAPDSPGVTKVVGIAKRGSLDVPFARSSPPSPSSSPSPSSFTLPRAASPSSAFTSFTSSSSTSFASSSLSQNNSNSFPIRASLTTFSPTQISSSSSISSLPIATTTTATASPSFSFIAAAAATSTSFSPASSPTSLTSSLISRHGHVHTGGSGSETDSLSFHSRSSLSRESFSFSSLSTNITVTPSPSLSSRTFVDSSLPPIHSSSMSSSTPRFSPPPLPSPQRLSGPFSREQKPKDTKPSREKETRKPKILPPLPLPSKKTKVPLPALVTNLSPISASASASASSPISLLSFPLPSTTLLPASSSSSSINTTATTTTTTTTTTTMATLSSLSAPSPLPRSYGATLGNEKGANKAEGGGRGRLSSDRSNDGSAHGKHKRGAESSSSLTEKILSSAFTASTLCDEEVCKTIISTATTVTCWKLSLIAIWSALLSKKRQAWSTSSACAFFCMVLVGFWKLLLFALRETLKAIQWGIRLAALTITDEHHLTFCFFFLYIFPSLTHLLNAWSPPWVAPCLWYAFLFQVVSVPGNPLLCVLQVVLPIIFLTQGISHNSLLLDLNGSERILVAFIITSLRTHQYYHVEFLLALSLGMLASLFFGTSVLIQWGVFILALVANHRGVKNLA